MKMNNKIIKIGIFVFMLLFMGVGYAYLNATVNIDGKVCIGGGQWNLHFANPKVNEVTSGVTLHNLSNTNKPNIITGKSKQEVAFEISFSQPGDHYGFEVDLVNDGTVDSRLLRDTSKILLQIDNGTATNIPLDAINDNIPSYLNYNITYTFPDSMESLQPNQSAKLKFDISLDSNIDASQLSAISGKNFKIRNIFDFKVLSNYENCQ